MRRNIRNWGNDILRAAIILLVLFYACWPLRLSGGSMEPTYYNGNVVCVSRLAGFFGGYDRGDVVVFDYTDEDGQRQVIKRVIVVEGDRLEIVPEGVMVNGVLLDEPYAMGPTEGVADLVIPPDTVFVLGDHRTESFDSRNMGVIAEKDLKGKVLFRLFPFFG